MNDFSDKLADIKKELQSKEPKKPQKKAAVNTDEKKYEFADEFDPSKESIVAREKRLQDEFLNYTKYSNINKI